MSPSLWSNTISTLMTTLKITLKVNSVEFLSQTEKQIDDAPKDCTSHFMMMKKTIIGQSAKSETMSIKCKLNPVVSDAKIKMKQRLLLDKYQCQDSSFKVI